MSYDFNIQDLDLDVPNPYKIENLFLLLSALILLAGGVWLIVVARGYMQTDATKVGVVTVALGGLLFAGALKFGIQALSQFRFYYGRQFPTGLAEQLKNGTAGTSASAQEVIEVMRQRAIEFPEPKGPLNGVLYAMFRNLITSPPQIQAAAIQHFHSVFGMAAILVSLVASYVLYGDSRHEGVISWLYLPLTGLSLLTPFVKREPPVLMQASNRMVVGIVGLIGVSILVPVLVEKHLPAFPIPPMWLAPTVLLVCSIIGSVIFLASLVAKIDDVKQTSVSCEQATIAMNCPPSQLWTEIGRDFQNNWVRNIPNRTYANLPPDVSASERGSFSGYVLEETQPTLFNTLSFSTLRAALRERYVRYLILLSVWGVLLAVASAGVAVYFAPQFVDLKSFEISRVVLSVIALGLANVLAVKSGHLLWSRMYFRSRLIWVECAGTFQTAKFSIGNQFTGKAQSSSTLTRVEDATLRVWVTDVVSVAFGKDSARHIMALAPADGFAKSLSNRLISFAANQSSVAVPTSTRDIGRVQAINDLNAALEADSADLAHKAIATARAGCRHIEVEDAGDASSRGTVKFFNTSKQFGFVNGDDGIDRFFNSNQLGGQVVKTGDRVTFRPVINSRGPAATQVRLIPSGAAV